MRIWCLTALTIEPYDDSTNITTYKFQGLQGSIDNYYEHGKIMSTANCLKFATNYVLSEIRIGKRKNNDFYFVLCRQGAKFLQVKMTKDALTILPRENKESAVIDILFNEDNLERPKILGHYIKKIRIRAIKNTKVKGAISTIEAKMYNEYAERINLYANGNPDKYEEAFHYYKIHQPFNLPNETLPKALEQKITDLYKAITDLCQIGLQNISIKERYNNYLLDNEVLRFYPGQYDKRIEDYKDFYGCRSLSYDSINLPAINEKWFLAEGLHSLRLTKTDVFNIPTSWEIFENNIGKLQQLTVLELTYCKIIEIPENVYENLPPSLECLILSNNNLIKISPKISKLVKLDKLSLNNNPNFIDDGLPWNDLPQSLCYIELDNTKITKIPASAKRLKALKVLNAQAPTLKVIEWDALNHLLEKLMISNVDVLQTAEPREKRINAFALNNAKIQHANDISLPVQAREIDLSKNNMEICDFNFSIPPYSLLKILILSGNKLATMEWEILPPTLTKLDLSHNLFKEIGPVRSMTKLEELKLNNNQIIKISDDLNQLMNIDFIDLSHNELFELPEGFELIDRAFLKLNLSYNKFVYQEPETNDVSSKLHHQLWNRLPRTYELSLNGNNIFELPCQLAGRIQQIQAMECKLKYICPQIYNILYDFRYKRSSRNLRIHLNIAKNADLKTLTFIPHSIYPVASSNEKPTNEHLYGYEIDMEGNFVNTKNTPQWTTIVSNENVLRKTQAFPQSGKKPIYAFKKVAENIAELQTFCKCCAYCNPRKCKNQNTVMVEQLMMMGCTFVVIKEDLIKRIPSFYGRAGWQAGKWKAMIRTRLCQECIEKLQNKAESAYEDSKTEESDQIETKKQRQNTFNAHLAENRTEAMDTIAYAEPQTEFTINLPNCYLTMEFLADKCNTLNLTFEVYPFHGYENYYNSGIFGTKTLYAVGIYQDENSGYKSISHLLTGTEHSYEAIRNILYNHLYLGNLHPNFYTVYSSLLASPAHFIRECDLYAIANLLQINIFVFNFLNDAKWFLINESCFESENNATTQFLYQRPSFLLLKTSENFYDAVLAASVDTE